MCQARWLAVHFGLSRFVIIISAQVITLLSSHFHCFSINRILVNPVSPAAAVGYRQTAAVLSVIVKRCRNYA